MAGKAGPNTSECTVALSLWTNCCLLSLSFRRLLGFGLGVLLSQRTCSDVLELSVIQLNDKKPKHAENVLTGVCIDWILLLLLGDWAQHSSQPHSHDVFQYRHSDYSFGNSGLTLLLYR